MGRSAAFFDLDKTVIAKSSALAFGRPFYRDGLITRRDVVKSAYAQLMFRLGGTDEQTMARTRDYLAALCKGWQVEQVRQIVAETLHELINPYVYAEAAALIEEHQAAGRDVVLVSASGEEMVRPIGELLGVTDVIATRMARRRRPVQRRGRVLRGRPEQGRRRSASWPPSAATTWPTRTPTPTRSATGRCWSASATRRAVNPDRALRKLAVENGWPVLEFRHPIPLGRRLRERPGRAGRRRGPRRRRRAWPSASPGTAAATARTAAPDRPAARPDGRPERHGVPARPERSHAGEDLVADRR